MDGIHIPAEVAEEAQVPSDLDSSSVAPYQFPSPERRRTASIVYLLQAVILAFAVPRWGWLFAAGVALLAWWHWRASWPLRLQPEAALQIAAKVAPFPVGQSSAAIIFSGWRSRPRWHVVMYDSASPPAARALVVIDGVDGRQIGSVYSEQLPLD